MHVMLELLLPFVIAAPSRGMHTFQHWSLHLLLKTTTIISFSGSTCKSCQMRVWNKIKHNRKNYHKESHENCLDFHSYMKNEGCDIFQSSTVKSINSLELSGLEMLIKGKGQIYKCIYMCMCIYRQVCVFQLKWGKLQFYELLYSL